MMVLASLFLFSCTGAVAPGGTDGNLDEPSGADAGITTPDGAHPVADADGGAPGSNNRIVAYFTAWAVYGRDYHVNEIPADRITHINYAFANLSDAGECVLGDPYADIDKFYDGDSWESGSLRGSFNQLIKLKAQHPHLRTMISVGGWSWSARFSDAALTEASRAKLVQSCVEFMKTYQFDGIDVDWEFPVSGGLSSNTTRPEDKRNYTLLMTEFRRQLDALESSDGREYELSIAAPAGPAVYANLEMAELAEQLDWINVMTYDFNGSWSPMTSFNAPLYASSADPSTDPIARTELNTDAAARAYLAAGVPASKVVVGVPFYGRGWGGVPATNDGLFQTHTVTPPGTWEAGVFDYADLAANYLPTYQRFVHPESKVPWLYSAATGIMISYDDADSLRLKAEYVRTNGLGGVMFWELSGDDSQHVLLQALNDGLQ